MWECNVGTAGCDASNTPTVDAEFGRTLAISALLPQSSTSTTAGKFKVKIEESILYTVVILIHVEYCIR